MKVRALLAGVAAVGLLTACSTPASMAMQVGDQQVSMSDVDRGVESCLASFPGETEADVRSAVVNGLYGRELTSQLSTASGTSVSSTEVKALYDSLGGSEKTSGECRVALQGGVALRLLTQKLGEEKTAALVKNVAVTVNPALGRVDASKVQITPRSGSLSSIGQVYGARQGS